MISRTFKAFCWTALGALIALVANKVSVPGVTSIHKSPSSAVLDSPIVVASPGRVEGVSEPTLVGAAIGGVLGAVFVREGERVKQASVIARIQCGDLDSALAAALADAEAARQARARLVIGSRDEERRMAGQKTQAARAVLEATQRQFNRKKTLFATDDVSAAAVDEAKRQYDVAVADLKAYELNEQLVNAPPLAEDLRRADANVRAAEEQINVAQDRSDKCTIRAPIDGTILHVYARTGESFSTTMPRPIVSMADLSQKRVRAEVDERDVGKVRVGQAVIISADAFGSARYAGRVERISLVMGRKTVETGDPAEKSDRDILEVLIALDGKGSLLPVGLRVVVQFKTLDATPPKKSGRP